MGKAQDWIPQFLKTPMTFFFFLIFIVEGEVGGVWEREKHQFVVAIIYAFIS